MCVAGDTHQHVRELPNLGQSDSDHERRGVRVGKQLNHQRPDNKFSDHDQPHNHEQQGRLGNQNSGINQDSHGHKEEGHECVPQRKQVLHGLVRSFGFAHQEAGEKCAQCQRQSDGLGECGGHKAQCQRHQDKELRVCCTHDTAHEWGNQFMRHQSDGNENQKRFAHRDRQCQQAAAVHIAERRQKDGKDHDGKVLDQRNPNHDLPVVGAQLAPFA